MGASLVGKLTATDLITNTKRCSRCRNVKSLTEFWLTKGRRGTGHAAWCRTCSSEFMREKRRSNPKRHRQLAAELKARNPERYAKYAFDAQLVKACRRAGITVERYRNELARQRGVCAICGSPQRDARMKRLVIDHDHVTGDFRGLLCSHCNSALGQFGDNEAIMEEAIAYLRRTRPLFRVVTLPSV